VRPLKSFWRAVIEIAFIIFLFYANLLMGEFNRNHLQHQQTILGAFRDVVTPINFGIALVSALVGHLVFQYLRRQV